MFFELVKNVFIFSLVINGTALITVINLNNPILNKSIPFIFYNLYLMFIFFIFILYYNFKLLRFLKHKKYNFSIVLHAYNYFNKIKLTIFLMLLTEIITFSIGIGFPLANFYNNYS